MTKIGLISDTHSFLDEAVFRHFDDVDEIWHAGDFGDYSVIEKLREFKPLRGVYGNIDAAAVRYEYPENLVFECEDVKVLMRHICGTPPKYNPDARKELDKVKPQLLVCGHSHILKIQYDEARKCLYMNPGAAGKQGWHKMRTLVRLDIDGREMQNCRVIELGKR